LRVRRTGENADRFEEELNISVIDPVEHSLNRVKRILFYDFKLRKWFILGFCAFLAGLGNRGCSNSKINLPYGGEDVTGLPTDKIFSWISENLPFVVIVGVFVLILAVAIGVLMQWLSSRGQFMFLDGVVRNRAAVSEPWHKFRPLGNSLFLFRFLLGVFSLSVVMFILLLCVFIAWTDINAKQFGVRSAIALFVGLGVIVPVACVYSLVGLILNDFVVPVMYLRGIKTMEAIRVFRKEILPEKIGVFVLFYLMRCGLGIAAGIIVIIVICLTFCIAALPYLSSVIFLPVLVFMRCYPLFFLEQFGKGWLLFSEENV
jgi:hypothetical protein